MNYQGTLHRMVGQLAGVVEYRLLLEGAEIPLNGFLGKQCTLNWVGRLACQACAKPIKKSYQGYCYPCTQRLARCDLCIVRPERCHFHLNTCREPSWGEANCFIPHHVYLANVTGLKVGITRQQSQRWIDQGAVQALPIYRAKNRRLSGLMEVEMAQFMDDKAQWRQLLQKDAPSLDLPGIRVAILARHAEHLFALQQEFGADSIEEVPEAALWQAKYPVLSYPKKIHSLDLMKTPTFTGTLVGIKGQYLLFEDAVFNTRKHQGFDIQWVFS